MRKRVMARLGVILVALCLPLAYSGPARASSQNPVFSLPYYTDVYECIGGEICGKNATVDFYLVNTAMITDVVVYADDAPGDKHKAVLDLFLDDQLVGSLDVKAAGSYLVFPVDRVGYHLQLRSRHEDFHPNGDETRIWTAYID